METTTKLNAEDVFKEARKVLGDINFMDEKYEYLDHDHWMTSRWSPSCKLCSDKPPHVTNITSSPVASNNHSKEQPTDQVPPPVDQMIIPITPLQPSKTQRNFSNFVTPMQTCTKYSDTFTRTTRQSVKKSLNTQQDLINLNETYDLYASALADISDSEPKPKCMEKTQSEDIEISNLPNQFHKQMSLLNEDVQPTGLSRIPRIPTIKSNRL